MQKKGEVTGLSAGIAADANGFPLFRRVFAPLSVPLAHPFSTNGSGNPFNTKSYSTKGNLNNCQEGRGVNGSELQSLPSLPGPITLVLSSGALLKPPIMSISAKKISVVCRGRVSFIMDVV